LRLLSLDNAVPAVGSDDGEDEEVAVGVVVVVVVVVVSLFVLTEAGGTPHVRAVTMNFSNFSSTLLIVNHLTRGGAVTVAPSLLSPLP
jgi:hypothetical protein